MFFSVVQQFSLCRQVLDPNRFHVRFNNFNQGPTSLCNWVRTILNWDSAVSITSPNPSTVSEWGHVGGEGDLQMAKASAASSPSPRSLLVVFVFHRRQDHTQQGNTRNRNHKQHPPPATCKAKPTTTATTTITTTITTTNETTTTMTTTATTTTTTPRTIYQRRPRQTT